MFDALPRHAIARTKRQAIGRVVAAVAKYRAFLITRALS